MNLGDLRKKIHEYIDLADENLLQIIYAILEEDLQRKKVELSEEDWKIIEQRREEFMSGKVKRVSAKEAIAQLRKKQDSE